MPLTRLEENSYSLMVLAKAPTKLQSREPLSRSIPRYSQVVCFVCARNMGHFGTET